MWAYSTQLKELLWWSNKKPLSDNYIWKSQPKTYGTFARRFAVFYTGTCTCLSDISAAELCKEPWAQVDIRLHVTESKLNIIALSSNLSVTLQSLNSLN